MFKAGRLLLKKAVTGGALLMLLLPVTLNAQLLAKNARLDFKFELPEIATSIYARPYVVVWIEDEKKQAVKTLQLWVGKDEWLKDLRSWWRKVGRYDRQLVDAVSSATRPSGQYRFQWDGTDDQGQRLQQGVYTLHIEVVREHGGRNYLRKKMTLSDNAFHFQLKASEETGLISVNYQAK